MYARPGNERRCLMSDKDFEKGLTHRAERMSEMLEAISKHGTLQDVIANGRDWLRNTPEGRAHADRIIRFKEGRLTEDEQRFLRETLEKNDLSDLIEE
jgi:hypothetical protein